MTEHGKWREPAVTLHGLLSRSRIKSIPNAQVQKQRTLIGAMTPKSSFAICNQSAYGAALHA
jgi:hypothetical protein